MGAKPGQAASMLDYLSFSDARVCMGVGGDVRGYMRPSTRQPHSALPWTLVNLTTPQSGFVSTASNEQPSPSTPHTRRDRQCDSLPGAQIVGAREQLAWLLSEDSTKEALPPLLSETP